MADVVLESGGVRVLADGTWEFFATTGEWLPNSDDDERANPLAAAVARQADELAALKADNAALLGSLGEVSTTLEDKALTLTMPSAQALEAQRDVIQRAHSAALSAYKAPHPGAALLEEMRALRGQVESLGAQVAAGEAETYRLGQELSVARAQVEALGLQIQACEAERLKAALALATARGAALEEVLAPLRESLKEADEEVAKHNGGDGPNMNHWNYWGGRQGRLKAEVERIEALKSSTARFVPEAEKRDLLDAIGTYLANHGITHASGCPGENRCTCPAVLGLWRALDVAHHGA